MEEVTDFVKDQKAKGQDMKTSKSHQEMAAISDAFKTTTRCFPMDCYLTIVAKWTVEDGRIKQVGFLPAYLPEDCAPYVLEPSDPRFTEVVEYMKRVTAAEGLEDIFELSEDGREIILK